MKYHAPVKKGEVAYSLLMELYASEELNRGPYLVSSNGVQFWTDGKSLTGRKYGLPATILSDGTMMWYEKRSHTGTYNPSTKTWISPPEARGAYLYVASFT